MNWEKLSRNDTREKQDLQEQALAGEPRIPTSLLSNPALEHFQEFEG